MRFMILLLLVILCAAPPNPQQDSQSSVYPEIGQSQTQTPIVSVLEVVATLPENDLLRNLKVDREKEAGKPPKVPAMKGDKTRSADQPWNW